MLRLVTIVALVLSLGYPFAGMPAGEAGDGCSDCCPPSNGNGACPAVCYLGTCSATVRPVIPATFDSFVFLPDVRWGIPEQTTAEPTSPDPGDIFHVPKFPLA